MSNLGNKEVLAKNLQRYLYRSGKERKAVCEELGISYSTYGDLFSDEEDKILEIISNG